MKTIFGYFLIVFSLLFIILIGFPQIYSNNSSGRIDKEVALDLNFLKQENSPIVLLFFGYVNCGDICAPAMRELNKIYEQLNQSKTKVYFLNILNSTNQELPKPYAQSFNKNFKGIYLNPLEIKEVSSKLNLSLSYIDNKKVSHTGHLFILEKNLDKKGYYLKYIYTTRPFDEKSIINDINALTLKNEMT